MTPRTCAHCGRGIPSHRRADAVYCDDSCSDAAKSARRAAAAGRVVVKRIDPYYDAVLLAYAGSCRCHRPLVDPESGDCIRCGHGRLGDLIMASKLYVPLATLGRAKVAA